MTNLTCWVNECPLPTGRWGMCEGHRALWEQEHPRKNTSLHTDLETKFEFYVERDSSGCSDWRGLLPGCWHWGGSLSDHGYGLLALPSSHLVESGTRMLRVHRISYEKSKGAIPEGYEVDHLCRVRPCVNPAHLEVVTPQTNNLRGTSQAAQNAVKTHCSKGHEYSPANTVLSPSGARLCGTCRKEWSKSRATGVGKGGYQTDRTHCPEGHPYEGENLIVEKRKKSDGTYGEVRKCRICVAAVRAARNARKRAQG